MSKLVYFNGIPDGGLGAEHTFAGGYVGLGAKPPAAGQFCGKKNYSYFNAIGSQFARV